MKPDDIGKAYDQITHLWESVEFDHSNGIEQHRRAIGFTKNKGNALDIGCGCTGRFVDLLLKEGFQPAGIDVSSKMVSLARHQSPNVEFVHADICRHPLPEGYDFITAWDSIWHVPLQEQEGVITKIVSSLNTGGVFIFSFGGTTQPGSHKDDAMGPEVYYSSLGTEGFLKLLMKLGCVVRHLEFDQYPELHAYIIVQKS